MSSAPINEPRPDAVCLCASANASPDTGSIQSLRTQSMKRIFLFVLALACLVGIGRDVHASCSFTAGNTLISTVALPEQITVPRNVGRGTVLWDSGWVQGGTGTASILCNAYFWQKMRWSITGLQPVADMPNVYALPDLPGVGIKAGWFWGSTGAPSTWAWIGKPDSWEANTTQAYILRSFLQVQLIAIGPIKNGTQGFPSPTINVWYDNANAAQLVLTQTSVKTNALACTTSDVLVSMGGHAISELSGPSTYTRAVDFSIHLYGCPPGMDGIKYQIDPATPVISWDDSVVALDGSAPANVAATGVGVQLLNRDGTAAFPLRRPVRFDEYDTSTGGNYTIPLKARYYQTEANVVAGWANSSMTFTMIYD